MTTIDRKFESIERMRTNVLKKAQESGLKIEAKINNHFDELLKKSRPLQDNSKDEGSKLRPTYGRQ
jgi:hypothetical protein